MHNEPPHAWRHDHSFGQDKKRPGELRTIMVIAITGTMMVAEVTAGILFGSMALLADGMHMASHTAALSISAFAYIYARRHAGDERFNFGTGKVNALGGFTGAVLLVVFAAAMAWESCERMVYPVDIAFNQAIVVAVLGLLVNGVSIVILGHGHQHDDQDERHDDRRNEPQVSDGEHHRHHDHNLRAAYLHVMADAFTSVLAIVALLVAKYYGLIWMDPVVGVVGAVLVGRWSLGLLHTTGRVLLDHQGPARIRAAIRESIEKRDANRVADLHVWSIGPNIYAAELVVVSLDPQPPDRYRDMLPESLGLVHVNIEVHRCLDEERLHEAHGKF